MVHAYRAGEDELLLSLADGALSTLWLPGYLPREREMLAFVDGVRHSDNDQTPPDHATRDAIAR